MDGDDGAGLPEEKPRSAAQMVRPLSQKGAMNIHQSGAGKAILRPFSAKIGGFQGFQGEGKMKASDSMKPRPVTAVNGNDPLMKSLKRYWKYTKKYAIGKGLQLRQCTYQRRFTWENKE
jgi:hypothetical protein